MVVLIHMDCFARRQHHIDGYNLIRPHAIETLCTIDASAQSKTKEAKTNTRWIGYSGIITIGPFNEVFSQGAALYCSFCLLSIEGYLVQPGDVDKNATAAKVKCVGPAIASVL